MLVVVAGGVHAIEQQVLDSDVPLDPLVLPLHGVPKGLMPVGGRPALSWFLDAFRATSATATATERICIVASAQTFKAYERWAMETGLPLEAVLSIGSSEPRPCEQAFLGLLDLALRVGYDAGQDLLVVGADFLPCPALLGAWTLSASPSQQACALADSNGHSLRAIRFPAALAPPLRSFMDTAPATATYSDLIGWLDSRSLLERTALPAGHHTAAWMQASVALADYHATFKTLDRHLLTAADSPQRLGRPEARQSPPIHTRVHARIGLIGNPSDGFFGRTISLLVSNFWASVTLVPNTDPSNTAITLVNNPICNPVVFATMDTAVGVTAKDGYYGATRLFMATLRVFGDWCRENSVALSSHGFSILYQTNIPRQVGLAGSSALVTALLKSLVSHHRLPESLLPLHIQANLALSAERDQLGINAGHQDRVVQAYGGVVYMDFDRALMTGRGYGDYERLPSSVVPPGLWIAYVRQPKESGKVHTTVKAQFEAGDPVIASAMATFAAMTTQARTALLDGDTRTLARLMQDNFELRRRVYGDAVIGEQTLRIVRIANEMGYAAKLSGSGGCVVGLWRGEGVEPPLRQLRVVLEQEGYIFCPVDCAE
ncbi:ribosomal protein S5 domain 2-type protein [Entophlyctis helioformis]|nr:ribosomal protein S5 domain 2-type protein [Entophlyctis helioformis]